MLFWFPKVTLLSPMPLQHIITLENIPKFGLKSGNVTLGHLGNLAPPGELEESASHHVLKKK